MELRSAIQTRKVRRVFRSFAIGYAKSERMQTPDRATVARLDRGEPAPT